MLDLGIAAPGNPPPGYSSPRKLAEFSLYVRRNLGKDLDLLDRRLPLGGQLRLEPVHLPGQRLACFTLDLGARHPHRFRPKRASELPFAVPVAIAFRGTIAPVVAQPAEKAGQLQATYAAPLWPRFAFSPRTRLRWSRGRCSAAAPR